MNSKARLFTAFFLTLTTALQASWDAQVLDKLLAGLPPDQETVRLGCMIYPVDTLRAWRDQLEGTTAALKEDSGVVAALVTNNPANLWPGGVAVYAFDANVSTEHRRHFVDAAREWSCFAGVTFVERTAQSDYIRVFDAGPSVGGGFSAVGRIGGAQDLGIGSSSWTRGTLLHEIGHALGFQHEHQRSDRDDYVVILTANIIPGSEANFIKLPGASTTNVGPYDFLSVMHYRRNTLSINPATLNTIVPAPGFEALRDVIGNSTDWLLSQGDRTGLATLYGAGPSLGAVVTNTTDSGVGSLRQCLYYAFDNPGTTITFNIPLGDPGYSAGVHTILPTAALPSVGTNTRVDGTTQTTATGNNNPAGPEVQIRGTLGAAEPATQSSGLRILGPGATVRGLVINDFAWHGVEFDGATACTLAGCYIGTNAAGTAAIANGFEGVDVSGESSGNTIGGSTAAARNLISGNTYSGVFQLPTN